jgi:hypothetical protein
MAYDQDTIEYAKSLYLEMNEICEHVYSERNIATLVSERLDRNVASKVVHDWIIRHKWKIDFEERKKTYKQHIAERELEQYKKAQEREEKARTEAREILKGSATNFEIIRDSLLEHDDAISKILKAAYKYNMIFLSRKLPEGSDLTWTEVKERMLPATQLVQLCKLFKDKLFDYSRILIEDSGPEDNVIEVVIRTEETNIKEEGDR